MAEQDVFWDAAKRKAINRLLHNDQPKQSRGEIYEKAALGLAIVLLALDVFWDLKINGSISCL